MNTGDLFKNTEGVYFIYTGESGGNPNPNDPTSYKKYIEPQPIEDQTEEVLDEPSVFADFSKVAYGAVMGIPDLLIDTVGSTIDVSEKDMAEFKNKVHDRFLNDLMAPGLYSKDTPEGRAKRKKLVEQYVDTETGRVKDPETVTGQVAEIGTFLTGAAGIAKMLPKTRTKIGTATKYLAAEQAAEQLLTSPERNVANFLEDFFPETLEENPVIDYLAAEEDDPVLEKRAKMALSSSLLGLGLGGGLSGLKGGVKLTGYAAQKTGKSLKDLSENQALGLAGDMLLAARNSKVSQKIKNRGLKAKKEDKELAQVLNQTGNIFSNPTNFVRRIGQKYFTSRGFLTEEGFKARRESIQNQRAINTKAEQIINRLTKFINEDVVYKEGVLKEKIYQALTKPVSNKEEKRSVGYFIKNFDLPKDVAEQVADARGLIDDLSKTLLRSDIITEETSKVITSNLGSYMRRSYKLFEEQNWKPSDEVVNDATNYIFKNLKEKSPDATRVEAQNIVKEIVSAGDEKEFFDYISANRINTREILSARKEIPEELRALMGEVKDPSENILYTVSKMAQASENYKFFSRIEQLGAGKYIFSKDMRNKKPQGAEIFSAKISGTNSSLDGMYTTPEMKKAIEGSEETSIVGQGLRAIPGYDSFLTLKGFAQKNQTVYDIQSQQRNVLGATQFALSNGLNPFKNSSETLDIITNQISRRGDETFDENYTKLQRLGVINTSVRANDYKKLLELTEDSGLNSIFDKTSNVIEKLGISKGVQRVPDDIYMAVDDTFKINAFHSELEVLKKAKPRTSIEVLEEEAAEIIKNTFPNYDLVPKGIKALRELPIGSFFSFPSEIIRTTGHILKQSVKEISSGNPLLIDRGVDRLSGFVGTQAFWVSAPKATAIASGLTEEEHEAINTLTETDYSKSSKIILREGDNIYTLDPSFLESYNLIREVGSKVLDTVLNDNKSEQEMESMIAENIFNVSAKILEPYTDPAILTKSISEVFTASLSTDGRSISGKRIFQPQETSFERAMTSFKHLGEALVPGAAKDLTNLTLNAVGSPIVKNKYTGETPPLQTELLANATGIRFKKFDLNDSLIFQARQAKNNIRRQGYVTINYNTTPRDIVNQYEDIQKNNFKTYQDLYKKIQAYQKLSPLGEAYYSGFEMLKKSGFSKKDSELLFSGESPVQTFTERTLNNIFSKGIKFSIDNEEDIRKIYYKYLFKNLSTSDRERKAGGGLVEDVPRASEEPDERVDKMTGVPYDQQAGEAFVDAEDYLRRIGITDDD